MLGDDYSVNLDVCIAEGRSEVTWRAINELRLRGLPKWLNEGLRHEGLK